MAERIEHIVLRTVVDFFVSSDDFNGIPASCLETEIGRPWPEIAIVLQGLVAKGSIVLAFYSHQDNPHILRIQPPDATEQSRRLHDESPDSFCVYPTEREAKKRADLSEFSDRPFSLRLALGEPQLTEVFFELSVLEKYHRDPRYIFSFEGFSGEIAVAAESYESGVLAERDQSLLKTFGIAYDASRNRVIIVFLRYLHCLTCEHQQLWKSHQLGEPCTSNGEYYRAALYGTWPQYHSAYRALLEEMVEINKIANLIGKPPLFRETFEGRSPKGFHPLLRATKSSLDDFILLLDKLMSENVNQDFFRGDIPLVRETERSDGRIGVQQVSTLGLLDSWFQRYYQPAEGVDVNKEVIAPLKRIRKLRQSPAHKIQRDDYDLRYPREQDALVGQAVLALRTLRLILSSHPSVEGRYETPGWLDSDRIVFY